MPLMCTPGSPGALHQDLDLVVDNGVHVAQGGGHDVVGLDVVLVAAHAEGIAVGLLGGGEGAHAGGTGDVLDKVRAAVVHGQGRSPLALAGSLKSPMTASSTRSRG